MGKLLVSLQLGSRFIDGLAVTLKKLSIVVRPQLVAVKKSFYAWIMFFMKFFLLSHISAAERFVALITFLGVLMNHSNVKFQTFSIHHAAAGWT